MIDRVLVVRRRDTANGEFLGVVEALFAGREAVRELQPGGDEVVAELVRSAGDDRPAPDGRVSVRQLAMERSARIGDVLAVLLRNGVRANVTSRLDPPVADFVRSELPDATGSHGRRSRFARHLDLAAERAAALEVDLVAVARDVPMGFALLAAAPAPCLLAGTPAPSGSLVERVRVAPETRGPDGTLPPVVEDLARALRIEPEIGPADPQERGTLLAVPPDLAPRLGRGAAASVLACRADPGG